MNTPLPIPATHQTLIACLRGAFHGTPADPALRQADWPQLLRQAQEQGVHTFLYPWLFKQFPDLFSAQATAAADSAPAAWRGLFLQALSQSALRQRQLAELLTALNRAKLDVIPLKGAWLCETVYDDPVQRTMNDLDLLIRQDDRDASHRVFLSLGYTVKHNALHNPFARDQHYALASSPWLIELHWDFASKMADQVPSPDMASIWENTTASTCCGQPVRQLSLEDGVSHLTHHLINHLFALPLRAYLDLALLIKKYGDRLSPERLRAAAARWKTGRATPFLLGFTSALFEQPLPSPWGAALGEASPARLSQACHALFHLPLARSRDGERTLLQFKNASLTGRLRLVASRIWMPRDFLVLHYPCARHWAGVPLARLLRAFDLLHHKSAKVTSILRSGSADAQLLADAEVRESLVQWLLEKTNEPA